MTKSKKNVDIISKILSENKVPFYGTIDEFEELAKIFSQVSLKIENSTNARDIIFEVWFLYDYYIRKLLLKAFELDKYENEDLDLMFTLLPQSFDSCLKALERIIGNQRKIYTKGNHPVTKFSGEKEAIEFHGWFLAHMMQENPELIGSIVELYYKYLKENEPKYYDYINSTKYEESNYQIVSRIWIDNCSLLNKEWFEKVRKLNLCRNKAAHIYDDSALYKIFGINGPQKLMILKTTIKELLKSTMNYEE